MELRELIADEFGEIHNASQVATRSKCLALADRIISLVQASMEVEVTALREKLAETEADLRSHGYKRDIALERAANAEAELADYRAYYEAVMDTGVHLSGTTRLRDAIARIEARRTRG